MPFEVGNIAPFINDIFTITSPWWTERNGTIHRGLDIATPLSKPVYSILTGYVHSLGTDSSQGNWIVIKDDITGYATRYMHLQSSPLLVVGQRINAGDYVAMEGSTGNSTGIHLHVEMQDLNRFNNVWHWSYNKDDYIDPTEFMGITNQKNTRWIYEGNPDPVYPRKPRANKQFPWVIYANKLRNMYNN